MISGFKARALAIATRCLSPPDNMIGIFCMSFASPTFVSCSEARSSLSFVHLILDTAFPVQRPHFQEHFSKAEVLDFGKHMLFFPMLRMGGPPATRIMPEVPASKSPISRRIVDFPQPDGPSRQMNSPFSTEKFRFSSIWYARRVGGKHFGKQSSEKTLPADIIYQAKA